MNELVQDPTLADAVKVLMEDLVQRFEARRQDLLVQRVARRQDLSAGNVELLAETAHMRSSRWQVDPIPETLLERRVELIGGANRSELINGLNAGAKSYIADLPTFTAQDTWSIMRAHKSLVGAAKRTLTYLDTLEGRVRVNPSSPTRLMMVPRPLFSHEATVQVNGDPVPAAFFDLAMYVLGCGMDLVVNQGGIQLYLRDVQGHLEARLWARLLESLEERMEFERGTIRVTVMIDSVAGALEAEEILFELMHHAAGLSISPQNYAADHIALFNGPDQPVMPDRETIGMNAPFLRALSLNLIGICHKRGCHAIGAPSFVLPSEDRSLVKSEYLEMLADKEREAVDGHDGTLVVHEDMVNASMVEFNKSMPRAHQLNYQRKDVIGPKELTQIPTGTISVESLKSIIRTALRSFMQYDEGKGWVVQGGRVHDRSSLLLAMRILWQWNHSSHGVITATKLPVTADLIKFMLPKEADKMFEVSDPQIKQKVDRAVAHVLELATGPDAPML